MKLVAFTLVCLALTACASEPKRGYELPPAMREVFRGGEVQGLTNASAVQGMPSPYDQVSHTCVSNPIWGLDGRYVRTEVRCW